MPAIIAGKIGMARSETTASLADNGETPTRNLADLTYTEPQVLRDWLP